MKKAAALANRDLGVLDAKIADAIIRALRSADRRRDARPVRHRLHPGRRRHVDQHERQRGDRQSRARECSATRRASTSTSIPTTTSTSASRPTTSIRRRSASALILRLESYMDGAAPAAGGVLRQGHASSTSVLKMGRTHLQDAVPMSLGAGVPRLGHDDRRGGGAHLPKCAQLLHEINLGATAIGTTVTAAPGYPELATEHLSELTGIEFILAERSDRGDLGHRRLRAAVRRAQAHRGQADQDLQRPPPAGVGTALRASTRSTCRRCSRAPRSCRAR